jgi:hypothetical protein
LLDDVSTYQLSGGWLVAANIHQNGGTLYSQSGAILQSGGTNIVSDTLALGGLSRNVMSGGRLVAQNLQVNGGAGFLHNGGTIGIPGLLTLENGTWDEQTVGGEQFGALQLAGSTSTLFLPANGDCIFHFADSSNVFWTNQAVLVIERWNGSPLGNGRQQIAFGNSAGGLTAQQLAQIYFHNPTDLATGLYPARMLATGEIVPDALFGYHSGTQLALYWGPGWTLQTTTNLAGQFLDMAGAASPCTIQLTEPQRFFRLRK